MQKSIIALALLALVASMMVTISIVPVEAKKPTAVKCNNIKVQVKVNGVSENETVVASATVGSVAKTKSGVVEENETSIVIPLNFKKVNPCPAVGESIFGDVNGTGFSAELKSLKKPNKVTVTLP
jgi:hypothetical protein